MKAGNETDKSSFLTYHSQAVVRANVHIFPAQPILPLQQYCAAPSQFPTSHRHLIALSCALCTRTHTHTSNQKVKLCTVKKESTPSRAIKPAQQFRDSFWHARHRSSESLAGAYRKFWRLRKHTHTHTHETHRTPRHTTRSPSQ